jgi:hypothetical protein
MAIPRCNYRTRGEGKMPKTGRRLMSSTNRDSNVRLEEGASAYRSHDCISRMTATGRSPALSNDRCMASNAGARPFRVDRPLTLHRRRPRSIPPTPVPVSPCP